MTTLEAARTYRRILLATDLTQTAPGPWAHALKLCVNARSRLDIVHVHPPGQNSDWSRLPTTRQMLTKWGVLTGEDPDEIGSLGISVHPHSLEGRHPADAMVPFIDHDQPDLVVLGTHRPRGLQRLWDGSIGEEVARNAPREALIVPDGTTSLVDAETGTVRRPVRILLPLGHDGQQQRAVFAAERFVTALWDGPAEFVFVHTGANADIPNLALPERADWVWRTETRERGDVVAHILERTVTDAASLVVMVTHGHDSLGDSLFGSTTERVIRDAPCPVLVVPAP